jgi:hypothetical protein
MSEMLRTQSDPDRIRKQIRAGNGGRELHGSYAAGTGSKPPRATGIRRQILADDPAAGDQGSGARRSDASHDAWLTVR